MVAGPFGEEIALGARGLQRLDQLQADDRDVRAACRPPAGAAPTSCGRARQGQAARLSAARARATAVSGRSSQHSMTKPRNDAAEAVAAQLAAVARQQARHAVVEPRRGRRCRRRSAGVKNSIGRRSTCQKKARATAQRQLELQPQQRQLAAARSHAAARPRRRRPGQQSGSASPAAGPGRRRRRPGEAGHDQRRHHQQQAAQRRTPSRHAAAAQPPVEPRQQARPLAARLRSPGPARRCSTTPVKACVELLAADACAARWPGR